MVTLLIISFLFLALVAIATYFWQRPKSTAESEALLPPGGWRGLFIDGIPDDEISSEDNPKAIVANLPQRAELLTRARNGEKSVLREARATDNSKDSSLYEEVLESLVELADSEPQVLGLVSYVTRHELPVNKKLAARFMDSCKRDPSQSSMSKMLHVSALADDATVYQAAVEAALDFWRKGFLPQISPQELLAILEGEFWLLSANTRSSGAGFLLKRTLSSARRELETAHNNKQTRPH